MEKFQEKLEKIPFLGQINLYVNGKI